ncbi:MAG: hypothetical protein GXZ04_00865 [Clostridiales bacterium]|nr:hypothetical protein [Clostridiales bacterium]
MMFRRRVEQALNLVKERRQQRDAASGEDNLDIYLEKGDKKAMLISAFLVFIPAALIVIGIMVLVMWLFFIR